MGDLRDSSFWNEDGMSESQKLAMYEMFKQRLRQDPEFAKFWLTTDLQGALPRHGPPMVVTFEVQHMKHSIQHAIGAYFTQGMVELGGQLDQAMASFDWDGEVAKLVEEQIREKLRYAISQAAWDAFRSGGELSAAIDQEVDRRLQAIAKSLRKEGT